MSIKPEQNPSIDKIREIATAVRLSLEIHFGADENPAWSFGACLMASTDLVEALEAQGFPASRYGGYYKDCEDGYAALVYERSPDSFDPNAVYKPSSNWSHWWVVCGEFIVDITADQFHPSCREDYRVVVTSLSDDSYSRMNRKRRVVASSISR